MSHGLLLCAPSAGPLTVPIKPNSSVYITYDFDMPVHGYPTLNLSSTAAVYVDFGYTEKAIDLYTGNAFIDSTGWTNPTG